MPKKPSFFVTKKPAPKAETESIEKMEASKPPVVEEPKVEKLPAASPSTVVVVFRLSYGCYNAGEAAGFPSDVAKMLISKKIAVAK